MLTTLSIISLDQGKIWRPETVPPEDGLPAPEAVPSPPLPARPWRRLLRWAGPAAQA